MKRLVLGLILALAALPLACSGDSTPTPAPTSSVTGTATPSATASATTTSTETTTTTVEPTASSTATETASETASPEPSETPSETATKTETPRPTGTVVGPIETLEPDPDAEAYADALVFDASAMGEGWTLKSRDDFSDSLTEGFEYDTDACNSVTNTLGQADDISVATRLGQSAADYTGPIGDTTQDQSGTIELEINVLNDEGAASDAAALLGQVAESDLLEQCFKDVFATELPDADVTLERIEPSVDLPGDGGVGAFRILLKDGEDELTFASEFYIWHTGSSWISLEYNGDIVSPETVKAAMAALQERLDANAAP